MNHKLIGLTGPARSGKSTVAALLAARTDTVELSFAEPIRRFVCELTGISRADLEGPLKEQVIPWLGVSPRRMMQTLGTEWGRELVNSELWIQVAKRKIERLLDAGDCVVISDVRFDNEANMIREMGGVICHIVRPGVAQVERHASEAGVTQTVNDLVLLNNKDIHALHASVRRAFHVG